MAGLGIAMGLPGLIGASIAGTLVGLGVHWKKRLVQLDPELRSELVERSNQRQSEALRERIRELSKSGFDQYAVHLRNFTQVKATIEKELHSRGELDEKKERIEHLVDTLVADVANQFETLTVLSGQAEKLKNSTSESAVTRLEQVEKSRLDLAKQIERAYLALREIGRNVDDLIDPLPSTQSAVSSRLEETISNLHDEAEVAQGVAGRLSESS